MNFVPAVAYGRRVISLDETKGLRDVVEQNPVRPLAEDVARNKTAIVWSGAITERAACP